MKKTLRTLFALASLTSSVSLAGTGGVDPFGPSWPKGMSPREIGIKLTDLFLSTSPYDYKPVGYASRSYTYPDGKVRYPIVCEWVAAIEFADAAGDRTRVKRLCAPFDAYYGGAMKDKLPTLRHVDFSVFGALPLSIYRMNGDRRALSIGLRYADGQWKAPKKDEQSHPHFLPFEKRMELFSKGYTPETRLWVDDMWMITILQVQAYLATGRAEYIDRAAKEMAYYLDELQNPDGLFFHAPDVPFVWGRGDGWFAAGMARLLQHLPAGNPHRKRVMSGYLLMMDALLKAQRPDGLWGQLVGDHGSWAETSGSGMFAYAFAVGVNEGWLDAKAYAPATRKAYLALTDMLDAHGNIKDVCAGTSKLNDRDYYLNRPRGVGDPHGQTALLWTATELMRGASAGGDPVVWTYWNHEPADHLRRMSYTRATIFSLGDWLPQWYDRLHGEELISKAAGLGVNAVYCHYFKGFGLKHEHAEMQRTKSFAEIAHRKGVKVFGYCQFNSLYYEAMLAEIPDLEKWTARTVDGGISTYGHYYRWSPCFESREFVDYIKRVVRYGVEEIGLDGFHFDNSYPRDCHCDRCQKAFREYLKRTVKDPRTACGLAGFDHVRLPPRLQLGDIGQEWHDALQIWRQKFRHARQARFLKEIFDYVKSLDPDVAVLHNPAYGRNDFELRGCDVALMPDSCDFMMAENRRFIRAEPDGKIVSQVITYKLGRRFGFRVFDSTWATVTEVDWIEPHVGIPRDADSLARFYAQGMIYGDITGCPWLVRSTKKGSGVILDDPVQTAVASDAFKFFRANESRLYDTVPAARTHLLYAPDTFYGWSYKANGFAAFADLSEKLNASAVPYTVIADSDIDSLEKGELLVLPDMRFLSRGLHEAIVRAGERGVKIYPAGKYGLFDENGRERALDDPVALMSDIKNKVDGVPDGLKVGLSASGIMAETQVNRRGEFILHLLRPGNSSTIGELEIRMSDTRATAEAELFSFDKGCGLVSSRRDPDGTVVLKVRSFRTMCSIVFR